MKTFNLIKWLWTDSHEKQSPQRFARYAAILVMLLTLGVGQMWAGTSTTLYYAVSTSYTVKCNTNHKGDGDDWHTYTMTKTSNTYDGVPIYSVTFTDTYNGLGCIQFQLYNGESFVSQVQPFGTKSWTGASTYNGKLWKNGVTGWKTYTYDHINLAADFTATPWSTTAYPLTLSDGTYSITVASVTASSHKFKITKWYDSWTDAIGYSNKVSGQNLSSGPSDENGSSGNNIVFTPSHVGSVKITYNSSTGNIAILAPYQVSYAAGTGATGTVSASSITTYGSTCTLSSSTFIKSGYTQDGWATSDGGDKAYNLGATYTGGYTDVTLYPHWTETMSTVSFVASPTGKGTFKVGGSTVTSTTAGVSTTRSVTAYPISGYHFVSWAITGGATISSTTTNPTTVTGGGAGTAATLTATFAADDVYSLTVAAGTGISAVTGSTNDIKAAQNIAITATVATGYTWSTWTKTAGSGTLSTFTAGTKDQTVTVGTAGDITLTASATEKKSTLTTSCSYSSGSPGYAAPTVSGSATTVGYVTTRTITATTPGAAYTLSSWTITNGTRTDGGAADANPITVRSNGDGNAVTVTANYTAKTPVRLYYTNPGNFSTPKAYFWDNSNTGDNNGWAGDAMTSTTECGDTYYYIEYYKEDHPNWNRVIFNDNGNSTTQTSNITFNNTTNNNQYNNAPASTSGTGSWTATPPARWVVAGSWDSYSTASNLMTCDDGTLYTEITTLTANTDYQFKIVDTYSSTWYGVTTATKITYENRATAQTMNNTTGGSPNQTMKTAAAGTYRFIWDPSNKKVTINYPTSYKVELEVGTVKGNANNPIIYHTSVNNANKVTSGNYVAAGTKIIFWIANSAAAAPKAGYNWWGFRDAPAGTNESRWTNNSVSVYTIPSISADAHIYAVFGENDYTVKMYNNGNGDVYEGGSIVTSTTAHVATASNTLTATPQTGYYFTGWDQFSDSLTINSPSTASTTIKIKNNKLGNNARLRANYSPQWSVIGTGAFGGWSAYSSHLFTGYTVVSTKDVGYHSITLAANTSYEIKVYDRQNSTTYGGSAVQTIDYAHSGADNQYTVATTASPKSVFIQSAAGGSYTLNWNLTDKKIAVVYPTSWVITTGQKTTGQADNAGGSFTATDNADNDVKGGKFVANNATVTFVATPNTGYTFGGWYSDAACTTPYTAGGNISFSGEGNTTMVISSITVAKDVYALFNPKTYTVTLTNTGTGYGSGGAASVTATYNQTLPAPASLPTAANGYAFMGYYSAADGEGTQFTNASGTWTTSVTDTISDSKWVLDAGATLYAYYKKAEITGITFDAATVEASGTVSFAVTVSPTPVAPTKLCFTVLHSNDNPLDDQPAITYNGGTGKYSFTASATSGTYKVQAVLRTGSSCDGGTELDTRTANFQVAGVHNVTVQYKCGDIIIKASETVTGRPLDATEITAPTIIGYTFSKWKAGDGITIEGADGNGEKESATINFTAIYDGKLTAIYTQKRFIYFYNTLNWENVYVYFYKDGTYWDNSSGTGTNPSYYSGSHAAAHKGQMLPVAEGSKIYYFDAEGASIPSGYTNVAFTEKQQDNCWYFYDNNKVSRRGDYSSSMPLFVPLSDQPAVSKNSGAAKYYCEGYWMNYPANSGYTLRIYDIPLANNATGASREFLIPFSEDVKMPLKQEVEVNFSGESWFIIYRNDGKYLQGENSTTTFKQSDHGDKKITSTPNAGSANKMRLISDGSGIYTFNLSFRGDGGSPENYDYYINVDFPAAVGDYRIVYSDNATWSNGAHGAGWYHPSDIIGKNTSETDAKEDTVSFFISHGSSLSMKFQRISAISESAGSYGQITWEDVPSGSITIPTSIEAPGVYNFIVTQPAGGSSISLVKAEPYTGNYYIRTDCAGETKWNNFRSPDHLITYSEYSITHGGYSHYYAHWVQKDDKKNIQFCIANDYSSAISDTLIRENNSDPAWANINNYIDEKGNILRNANVRFMWNQSTNKVSRAYVDGAQDEGSRFLVISSTDGMIKKADGSALSNNEVTFSDNENWIYEANVKAQPNALIKLKSTWGTSNTIEQYFKGSSTTTEKLIGGSGSLWYDIRILYDFKTNRLIASYIPVDENITTEKAIEADIMFIREHQGDIAQLTFGESGKISKIETAYGVMRFNKWTLANKDKSTHTPLASPASIYERSLFWISFPFKVKLSEVIGFGSYGEHWAIQRYDGAARAQKGHFLENGSFWRWMNRNTEYLEPNQGYLLAIDLDLLGETSDVWGPASRSEQIELYFPSFGKMPDITNADVEQTIPLHECTINRAATEGLPDTKDPRTSYNRTIFDSHWNVMSVPTYVNTDDVSFVNDTWTGDHPSFLYTWNADDNTITATSASGYTYHAMHAYMVQYGGDITWSASSGSPAGIVARRTYAEKPSKVEFRLELQQNEKMIDRTFVALSDDEETSAGFRFGEDLTKEFNNKSSIYTSIPGEALVAGNTLPMSNQTTVVPVGVDIKTNGDYTFAIPDGTSGIGVTLIDTENNIRTSLSALSYTVNLTAGTHDGRFLLEIAPIQQTPTDIDLINGENGENGVRKMLIDQQMYIIRDGKIYDARGARVQ